jgi:tetratricopeptide (TPR) repeat protein/serine phosphatase RsbU (regulator of sigma subunit)
MTKHYLSIFLLVLISQLSIGNPIDSLLNLIDRSNDERKFELWTQVGLHYREAGNFDSAKISFNEALKFLKNKSQQAQFYHNQGSLYWRFGKFNDAVNYYDSALDIRTALNDTTGIIKSQYYLSLVYRDLSQYDKSLSMAGKLVALNKEVKDSVGLADTYNHLGGVYIRLNQYDSATFWYEKAIEIRFAMNDSMKIADSYSNMGKIAREQSSFDNAINYYKKALDIYNILKMRQKEAYTRLLLGGTYWASKQYQKALQEYLITQRRYEAMNNKPQVASVLKNIGLIYRDIGNIDKAVEYHQQSLEIYRQTDNLLMIGIAINILGGDYWSAGNFNQALDTYQKALDVRKKLGNKTHIAGSYNNVALAYKSLQNNDSAMVNYGRALKIYKELNDRQNEAAIYNNIGNLFKKNEQWDSAYHYLHVALKIRKEIGHKQGIGYSSFNLAQVLVELNKTPQARQYLLEAEELARQLEDNYLIKESCLMLSGIYKKAGLFEKSLFYFQEYHDAEKRLQLDESIRRVADMQIRFEAEKRQRIVEKKDAELQQQKMRIYFLSGGVILLIILIIVAIAAFLQKRKSNRLLALRNQEIEEQKAEIEAQRDLATEQRDMIAEQKTKITDSILYASRIQNALLPPESQMDHMLKQHFILFKPRDVVSGDFYYFQKYKQYTVIVAADCTGHGVPGAFMSMLGISMLNEIMAMENIENAAQILDILRNRVKRNLHQTSVSESNSDGMDLAMILLNRENLTLHFAGANNPLLIVREGEMISYEGDRMPIGVHIYDEEAFTNQIVNLKKGDKLYMFSDGYVDQFGGKRGRKLMSKNFKNLLLETSQFPLKEQREKLEQFFDKWKGDQKQIDDIVIIGLEI